LFSSVFAPINMKFGTGPHLHAKCHVGITAPKLSKSGILAINLHLFDDSFVHFFQSAADVNSVIVADMYLIVIFMVVLQFTDSACLSLLLLYSVSQKSNR